MCYSIVAAIAYVLVVAFLYAPKCPRAAAPAVDPTAPIDYFPEPIEETEPAVIAGWDSVETAPEVVTQAPAPVTQAQDVVTQAMTQAPAPEVAEPADLASLGIRQLKKLASAAKVKGYGKMTKAELVGALA